MDMAGISIEGLYRWWPIDMEAIDGLVDRLGVIAVGEVGEDTGVPGAEARVLAGATLGDCSGDCGSCSCSRRRRLLRIGGKRGVELCASRSVGSSTISAALMSRGSGGGFGRVMEVVLERAGVVGGVNGALGSRWKARDRVREGACSEDERDGGALRTLGLDREVVALRSLQRLVIDGQRRLCRLGLPLTAASPDLRRLNERTLVGNPEKLTWSSPCVHSGLPGVASTGDAVIVFRCSQ